MLARSALLSPKRLIVSMRVPERYRSPPKCAVPAAIASSPVCRPTAFLIAPSCAPSPVRLTRDRRRPDGACHARCATKRCADRHHGRTSRRRDDPRDHAGQRHTGGCVRWPPALATRPGRDHAGGRGRGGGGGGLAAWMVPAALVALQSCCDRLRTSGVLLPVVGALPAQTTAVAVGVAAVSSPVHCLRAPAWMRAPLQRAGARP
jgi:hypothetical protein